MSKSLETEYKEMIRADLPDLWGKIEAKLDAQEQEKAAEMTAIPEGSIQPMPLTAGVQKETEISENNLISMSKRRSSFRWQYFWAAAAAVLCLVVAIPVLRISKEAKNDSTSYAPQAYGGEPQAAAETGGESEAMMTESVAMAEDCAAEAETEEAAYEMTDEAEAADAKATMDYSAENSLGLRGNAIAGTENAENDAMDAEGAVYASGQMAQTVVEGAPAESAGAVFVPRIVITAEKDTAAEKIEKLAEKYNMTIVEKYDSMEQYVLQPEEGTDADMMDELQKELAAYPFILSVEIQ